MDRSERALRARIEMALALAAIAVFAFIGVFEFGFVYDDHWTLVENRWLDRPLGWLLGSALSGRAVVDGIPDATRPTMIASLFFDRRLFGSNPAGYHAHSLVLYALTCGVAGLVAWSLTRRLRIALAAGAFFTLAPIHAEVVAAVNYREDLIAALCGLLVLARIFAPRARPESALGATLVALVWLVGAMAKESAIFAVIVTIGILGLRRPARSWYAARSKSLFALASVAIAWSAWRVSLRLRGLDDVPLAEPAGVATRLFSTARYEVRAVVESIAPFGWSPEYAPERTASALWLVPFVALVLGAIALANERSTRPLGLGLCIALLAALPSSPLVGPANPRADRYLFVSVLGGGLVWGYLVNRIAGSLASRLRSPADVLLLLLPVLVPMALVGRNAAAAWRSDLSLWTVASERAPSSYRSWVGLSRAERLAGNLERAEASAERAISLFPNSLSAHVTRAYVRLSRGDVDGARADIAFVRDHGGARQRGLRRAAFCAEQPPDKTRACIDGKP